MATQRNTDGRKKHDSRKRRESLSTRLGKVARQIKARDNHECQYCGSTAEESGAPLQLDHIVPRSQGGPDTAENLVVSCRSCNCARKTLPLSQWSRYVAALHGLHHRTIADRVRRQLRKPLPLAA